MKTNKTITLATAALAFSLLASASLPGSAAAAAKTTADFTDLSNVDAKLKTTIDAMLAAGLFEGVSEHTFGINDNMTRAQFAKIVTKVAGVTIDPTVKVSSFSDVRTDDAANGWAIPFIEAAKTAGLIDGLPGNTFAPGDPVTAGQLDTVLLKVLQKTVDVTGSPWYTDAVKQATELGFHPVGKSGEQNASRLDLVQSAYAVQNANKPDAESLISIVSTQASTDAKKITVSLSAPVDISKATLALTKDSAAVTAATQWSADGKSATLTVDSALAAGDYTVTLGGLDASTVKTATGTFTVAAAAASNGNITINGTYTIPNVLDSGLTEGATGSNGLVSKATADDPTLSKLAKELEVKVTDNSGGTIATPGVVLSAFSSNPAIAKVGVSADKHAYVIGNKVGTADISLTVQIGSGDAKQLHVTVTVTADPIKAKEFKAGDTSFDEAMSVVGGVYKSDFNAYTAMDLTLTDNYGLKYENTEIRAYNFALGTLFITNNIQGTGNPADGAVGTVTVDADGTVHVEGNVASFELTAIANGDVRATSYVTMTR